MATVRLSRLPVAESTRNAAERQRQGTLALAAKERSRSARANDSEAQDGGPFERVDLGPSSAGPAAATTTTTRVDHGAERWRTRLDRWMVNDGRTGFLIPPSLASCSVVPDVVSTSAITFPCRPPPLAFARTEGPRVLTYAVWLFLSLLVLAFGLVHYSLKDSLDGARATFGSSFGALSSPPPLSGPKPL